MKALAGESLLFDAVIEARRLMDRMRGLLGRDGLPAGTCMLIDPCGSIHTFYMKFALDVVFLDSMNRVVRVVTGVEPGRMVFGGVSACKVLECKAGGADISLLPEGTQIVFS